MHEPGQKLRRARERMKLKYRDVVEASQQLAELHQNREFLIGLSRLSDIENKGTVPSIFRLYTLCAVYKLNLAAVLRWYGVNLDRLQADSLEFARKHSTLYQVDAPDRFVLDLPVAVANHFDPRRTSYLGEQITFWGRIPAGLLQSQQGRKSKYALVGTEDWSMAPLIPPGSFLLIDEHSRRPEVDDWTSELDRPIFFFEHRSGYQCGWCSVSKNQLVVQSHPSSRRAPDSYVYPGEVEVVGRVIGVAMRMDQAKQHRTRS